MSFGFLMVLGVMFGVFLTTAAVLDYVGKLHDRSLKHRERMKELEIERLRIERGALPAPPGQGELPPGRATLVRGVQSGDR